MADTVSTLGANVASMDILQKIDKIPSDKQAQEFGYIPDIDAQMPYIHTTIVADLPSKGYQKRDCDNTSPTPSLSPFQRLPSEILEIIFILCLPKKKGPVTAEAPLSLMHTCSLWRRVALRQSELWSELSICMRTQNDAEVQNIVDLIHLWFDSAQNRILSFFFQFHIDDEVPIPEPIVQKLLPYMCRFRVLSLEANKIKAFDPILLLPPGYMDQLEYLSLDLRFTTYTALNGITAFSFAPRLRKLYLCVDDGFSTKMRIPWSQLTHINMLHFTLIDEDWPELLCQCGQLIIGVFSVYLSGIPPLPTSKLIMLPNLTDLRIESECIPNSILDGMALPALVKFTYSYVYSHSIDFTSQLPKLQSLTLSSLNDSGKYIFKQLLKDTPLSLTHLRLDFTHDFRFLCESLTHREGQPIEYLPQLEELDMSVWQKEDGECFDAESFISMVLSRQASHDSSRSHFASLKTVILRWCRENDEQLCQTSIPDEFIDRHHIGKVEFVLERNIGNIWLGEDLREWS